MASASPEPHLEKLPLEIFLECMKLVPDVPSLTSCMTVSKKIRNDLTGNLSSICQAVITNEIGSDLLPIAICRFIAEHESSGLPGIIEAYANLPGDPSLGSKYEDCATRFFTKYLRGQAMNWVDPPSGFTLDTVQNLSKFHSVVCQFANRLINDIIPFMPDYGSHPVTPEERARFCKAIYTRELVALVVPFQNGQGEVHREVYKSFWRCFAPWESKQVLCVSNALIYSLSPPFMKHANMGFRQYIADEEYQLAHRRAILHPGLLSVQHFLHSKEITDADIDNLAAFSSAEGKWFGAETGMLGYPLWLASGDPNRPALSFNMPDIMKRYRDFGNDSGPREAFFFYECEGGTDWRREGRVHTWLENPNMSYYLFTESYFTFFSRERWDSLSDLLPTMEELIGKTSTFYMDHLSREFTVEPS